MPSMCRVTRIRVRGTRHISAVKTHGIQQASEHYRAWEGKRMSDWLADAWGENPLLASDRAQKQRPQQHSEPTPPAQWWGKAEAESTPEPPSDIPGLRQSGSEKHQEEKPNSQRDHQSTDFPEWHPAALGIDEDAPGVGSSIGPSALSADVTTPHTTPAEGTAPGAGTDNTSRSAGETRKVKNTGQSARTARRYNPDRKKGFRRPRNNNSPFAPAIGAQRSSEQANSRTHNPQRKAGTRRLFREGSALNDALTPEEETLIRGIAAEENQKIPGTRGRAASTQARREETDPYTRAKTIVYNQLAYSAKSRAQLHKKLESKGFEAELIEPLLDKFEAAHLIDDAEYARSFVTQRGTGKKLSRSALRRELKERGITGDLAEEALAARTDEDERRDAAELVRKKLRPAMNFSDRAEKEKIMRRLVGMLARRGYSSSVAFSVVKEEIERYCSEWEEDS